MTMLSAWVLLAWSCGFRVQGEPAPTLFQHEVAHAAHLLGMSAHHLFMLL